MLCVLSFVNLSGFLFEPTEREKEDTFGAFPFLIKINATLRKLFLLFFYYAFRVKIFAVDLYLL